MSDSDPVPEHGTEFKLKLSPAQKTTAKYKAAGLCVSCGKPRAPGTTTQYCQYHIDRSKARSRQTTALRDTWEAQGLCRVDGKDPVLPGLLQCAKHASPLQAMTKEQKDEKIRKNECLKCEKPRIARNKRYCEDHHDGRVAGRRKQRYEEAKQAGRCVMHGCTLDAVDGVYCTAHNAKVRDAERKRYETNKALGICLQCSITLPPERAGMTNCGPCEKAHAQFAKEKHYTLSLQARFNKAQKDAKNRGLDWKITLEEFRDLFYSPCDYCGRDVEPSEYSGYRVDRKDNNIGYLTYNCVPCCAECNWIKGNVLKYDEMLKLVPALTQIRIAREAKEPNRGRELLTKYKREVYDEEGSCVEVISDDEEFQRAYEVIHGVREDAYLAQLELERERERLEELDKEALIELLLSRQTTPAIK